MSNRILRPVLIGAIASAAIVTTAIATCGAPARPAVTAPSWAAAAGHEARYELRWSARSAARGAGGMGGAVQTGEGSVDLAGELVIRAVDDRRFGLRLARIDHARLTVLDHDVVATPSTILDTEVIVELDAAGAVVAVEVPADAPPGLAPLLRAVAVQAQVPAGAAIGGELEAPALLGRARDRYRRDGVTVTRERLDYAAFEALPAACVACVQEIDGAATIELDAAGAITAIRDRETTVVRDDGEIVLRAENDFVLEQRQTRRATAPRRTGPMRRADGASDEATATDDLRAQIAGDLTLDGIAAWIVRFAASGTAPDDPVWLARAAALLQLQPEHIESLLALFEAPNLPDAARLMIADILVATGTPRAQAALRRAVEIAAATDDETYAAMITRVGLLTTPTGDTAAFVAALRAQPSAHSADVQGSVLYTEGAVIGRLAATDRDAAVAMARALEAEALATDDPDARAHLLVALGNADLDETLPTILDETRHADPRVRAAAAMALHRRRGGAAGEALVGLATDAAPNVQHIAFHLLGTGAVNDEDLSRLAARVVAGEVGPGADGTLVTTLAVGAGRIPGIADALRVVLARNGHDGDLVARIQALLG